MNKTPTYELEAEMFYRMTGYAAPGKYVPANGYPVTIEERESLWLAWLDEHKAILRAMELSMNVILPQKRATRTYE